MAISPDFEPATVALGFLLNDPRCHLRVYDHVNRVVLDVYLDKSRVGDLLAGQHGIPARIRRWPAAEPLPAESLDEREQFIADGWDGS